MNPKLPRQPGQWRSRFATQDQAVTFAFADCFSNLVVPFTFDVAGVLALG